MNLEWQKGEAMKKILGLGLIAIMIMVLVGGGTWAYFNDQETSSGNIFAAGTLNLVLTGGTQNNDSVTGTFSSSNWAPGNTKSANITIANSGSMDMAHLTLAVNYGSSPNDTDGMVDTSNRPTYITGSPWSTDPTDYFDKMITITYATWNGTALDGTGGNGVTANLTGWSLSQLRNGGTPISEALGVLGANSSGTLDLTFTFGSTATNGCQGSTTTMKITVTGTQN